MRSTRERNFGDGENLPAFAEGEPEDGDEDYQDDINDEGDDPGAEDEDPNRDEDAEEDDEQAATEAIPRKQKFSSFEKVGDADNFDRLPDRAEETFVWSNKSGELRK